MDDSDIINNFIPCEICNELIPFSEYQEHVNTRCGLISNSINRLRELTTQFVNIQNSLVRNRNNRGGRNIVSSNETNSNTS